MKFSVNWLKEFVDIDVSANELAERLTLAGQEVEGVIYLSEKLQNIIVGRIDKIEKHPDADKLVITTIFDGKKNHQIVTGATNVFEGAIVPVSLPGAVLANGLKIKNTKLRGVASDGMLCSEVELGVADDAAGIWILPSDTPLGVDFIEYADLKDVILDIGVLPNRGDCQSIYGMAREVAAVLRKPLKEPEIKLKEIEGSFDVSIDLDASEFCPLYTGRLIKDVQNNETPMWMKRRLQVSGVRPLGLLVDITNYVLLEMGQPLHAFDAEKLSGSKIVVRAGSTEDVFQTLDDEERKINKDTLLICDSEKPVALAGIMGGKNSEVADATKNIFLEAAYFLPGNIRKTASRLGLRSESSVRFEKGIDPDSVVKASDRASYLFQELASGKIIKGLTKNINKKHKNLQSAEIVCSIADINKLLGTSFSEQEIVGNLSKLGFELKKSDKDNFVCVVPSWRRLDVQDMPCLAEEISRILGLDSIPAILPNDAVIKIAEPRIKKIITQFETMFINTGVNQVQTFSMVAPEDSEKSKIGKEYINNNLSLKNALSVEESVMRSHMLASLLKVFSYNAKRQAEDIKIFEIGKVFSKDGEVNKEELHSTALFQGKRLENIYLSQDKQVNEFDFSSIKGLAVNMAEAIGFENISFSKISRAYLHPKIALEIVVGDVIVGEIGVLHPQIVKNYDLSGDVGYLNFNLDILASVLVEPRKYEAIGKFPCTRRDIAILAPKALGYDEISTIIEKYLPAKANKFFLFDCFESEKIGLDKKSLAFAFIYQDKECTLSDEEVNSMHKELSDNLLKELPVIIR